MNYNNTDEYSFTRYGRLVKTKLHYDKGYWWTDYEPHLKATSLELNKV